jgi:hypothetical protein
MRTLLGTLLVLSSAVPGLAAEKDIVDTAVAARLYLISGG